MIIEGKHAEYGQGIFISDLQEASSAAVVSTPATYLCAAIVREELAVILTCE